MELPSLKTIRQRYLLIAVISLILFLMSTITSYALFSYNKLVVSSTETTSVETAYSAVPTPTPDPLAPYNVLLLGYGGGGHAGGEITDTMIVAQVIPREKRVILISIPRDMWVPLPLLKDGETSYRKINNAYPLGNDPHQYLDRPEKYQGELGGTTLAEDMVELVTGLPIRYFVVVNFNAFEQAVNNLGGILVNVPVDFTDEYYPIEGLEDESCGKSEEDIEALTATISGYKLEQEFKCRYETLEFSAGMQPMDGATALKFVRSRHSQTYGNDFSRSQRQQAVILALKNKMLSLGTLPKLVPLINTLTSHVRTDIGIGDIKEIWSTHGDLKDYTLETINLSTDNVLKESRSQDGQYILTPIGGTENWQAIHEYLETEIKQNKELDKT